MSLRPAVGFQQDAQGDWIATLACGHSQHVRHRPPFELRPWVLSEAGRRGKLGAEFDCLFCEMPQPPALTRVCEQSGEFDETSAPAGLFESHRLPGGVWGRIVVLEGLLKYEILEGKPGVWILRPGVVGSVAPELAHRLLPCGRVRFRIELLELATSEASEG